MAGVAIDRNSKGNRSLWANTDASFLPYSVYPPLAFAAQSYSYFHVIHEHFTVATCR